MNETQKRQRPIVLALLCAAPLLWALPRAASAQRVCSGTISGSALGTFPLSTPISFTRTRDTAESNELSAAFAEGYQSAGGVIRDEATTRMVTSFLLRGPAGSPIAGQAFVTLSGLAQAIGSSGGNPFLTLTATLTNTETAAMLWVGSVECTIRSNDPVRIAHDLGAIVARGVGRSVQGEAIH